MLAKFVFSEELQKHLHWFYSSKHRTLSETLPALTCIQEVPGSYLGWDMVLSWPRTFVVFLRSSKRMLVLHIEIINDQFLLSRSQNVTVPSSSLQLYNISSWFSVVKYASILPSESYGTHGNCECSKSFATHSNLSEAFNSKYRTKIEYFAGTRGRDIALI